MQCYAPSFVSLTPKEKPSDICSIPKTNSTPGQEGDLLQMLRVTLVIHMLLLNHLPSLLDILLLMLVTLGGNICLLKEDEDGELEALVEVAKDWLGDDVSSKEDDVVVSRVKTCDGSFQKDSTEKCLFFFNDVITENIDLAVVKQSEGVDVNVLDQPSCGKDLLHPQSLLQNSQVSLHGDSNQSKEVYKDEIRKMESINKKGKNKREKGGRRWDMVSGRGDFVLKEKLRMLKISLKKWNIEVFGWLDLKAEDAVKEFNDLNFQVSNSNVTYIDTLASKRGFETSEVWNHLILKKSLSRQKSRALWLKEGDMNSSFFRKVMRAKYRRNFMYFVNSPDERKEKVDEIKSYVCNFFEANFHE
ncbi:hypothetical protein KIW84_063846 [Lathyrus oleraceus]|uniref:RNA-directed DNA polymerase, eukaryota, reverse transcriptase zinc-binding domain protein n=1 Tax=Pisum sativum TaxID=3888 RepID=A0A9D5AA93_PEA|nr:hypothetical protein KIW84_063846 [Pisum sativum]